MFATHKKSKPQIAREAFVEIERHVRQAHSKGSVPDPRRIAYILESAMSRRAAGSAVMLALMTDFLISAYDGGVPDASTLRIPK